MENNLKLRDRQLKEKGLTMDERLKIYRDEVYKQGMDALEAAFGGYFEAQEFLDLYYIDRIEESRGRDFTKWWQDNNPWRGMSIEEINQECDKAKQLRESVKCKVYEPEFETVHL
jgi:hypothetical protein